MLCKFILNRETLYVDLCYLNKIYFGRLKSYKWALRSQTFCPKIFINIWHGRIFGLFVHRSVRGVCPEKSDCTGMKEKSALVAEQEEGMAY